MTVPGQIYMGETGRAFEIWKKGHGRNVKKRSYINGSNLGSHSRHNGHDIDFEKGVIIDTGNYRSKETLESWHTEKTKDADSKPLPNNTLN
jgi:hypothetical protein